ncbi:nonstructural protein [Blackfly microvirus SF02]|uniref:Nonstructural protein n=1 Tax=Blackfly microvirus SF02 TaxID=2576452 RepID=A0A4P8PKS4_9VIRU|nr:nonstructural protein [Blackfly microvirus SF02]
MQTVKIFSVWDSKSKTFSQPFYAMTVGVATRNFTDLVNDPQTQVNKYPDDFTLFELGEFEDSTGKISSENGPQSVINAMAVLREDRPQSLKAVS